MLLLVMLVFMLVGREFGRMRGGVWGFFFTWEKIVLVWGLGSSIRRFFFYGFLFGFRLVFKKGFVFDY